MLLRDPAWSSRLDPKLQSLLTELDTALGTTVRAGAGKGQGGATMPDSLQGAWGDDGTYLVCACVNLRHMRVSLGMQGRGQES